MDLHIHLVRQESRLEGQPLPPESDESGYHAIFAFELLRRPYNEFHARARNPMMAAPLFEAWDRQIHFIESLHLPGSIPSCNPVFELRFIAYPDRNQVDLFLLGKAFAQTSDQARSQALVLGHEVFSLFPFDFVLHPLSNRVDFERAYRSEWIANLKRFEQIVEVRRFERLVSCSDHGDGLNPIYLTHNWEWHLQSMEQVWCALPKYQQPLMFIVNLSPTLWNRADYVYLNELEHLINEGAIPSALAPEVDSALNLYRLLLHRTPRPFTMRIVLVGISAAPRGLANAVGAGLCLPSLQIGPNETTPTAHYTLTQPGDSTDLSLARLNLARLSQCEWGSDLIGIPIRRLRYAVNARQAQAVFRIPIPPETGFPDIFLGREVV